MGVFPLVKITSYTDPFTDTNGLDAYCTRQTIITIPINQTHLLLFTIAYSNEPLLQILQNK